MAFVKSQGKGLRRVVRLVGWELTEGHSLLSDHWPR